MDRHTARYPSAFAEMETRPVLFYLIVWRSSFSFLYALLDAALSSTSFRCFLRSRFCREISHTEIREAGHKPKSP